MTIMYEFGNKSIRIYSEKKTLSSDFKKWFLCQLTEKFDLYEERNHREIEFLVKERIKQSATFNPLEIEEHRRCYENSHIDYLSFDDFLDSCKVAIGNLYVFAVGIKPSGTAFRKDKNLFAYIDLFCDGDLDGIFIDKPMSCEVFINLVEEYNRSN